MQCLLRILKRTDDVGMLRQLYQRTDAAFKSNLDEAPGGRLSSPFSSPFYYSPIFYSPLFDSNLIISSLCGKNYIEDGWPNRGICQIHQRCRTTKLRTVLPGSCEYLPDRGRAYAGPDRRCDCRVATHRGRKGEGARGEQATEDRGETGKEEGKTGEEEAKDEKICRCANSCE